MRLNKQRLTGAHRECGITPARKSKCIIRCYRDKWHIQRARKADRGARRTPHSRVATGPDAKNDNGDCGAVLGRWKQCVNRGERAVNTIRPYPLRHFNIVTRTKRGSSDKELPERAVEE
jgi:hypothetical protein